VARGTQGIYPNTYILELPASSAVHPVFHVSKLKKVVSPDTVVNHTLLDSTMLYQVLEAILDTRVVHRGEADVAHVLIKWSNMEKELATWEDREALHQQFLGAPP
jgi:hypothetical protein